MNKKYYHENSITTILTHEAAQEIDYQLRNDKCKICGSDLVCITFMEGSFISCSKDIYHKCDCVLDYGDLDEPPKIVRRH